MMYHSKDDCQHSAGLDYQWAGKIMKSTSPGTLEDYSQAQA
jgi:hypothetical protein